MGRVAVRALSFWRRNHSETRSALQTPPTMPTKCTKSLNCGDGCACFFARKCSLHENVKCLHRSRHGMSRVCLISTPLFGFWQQEVMLRSQFAMSFFAACARAFCMICTHTCAGVHGIA